MQQFVIIRRQIEKEQRGEGSFSLDVSEFKQVNLLKTIYEQQNQKRSTPTNSSKKRGFGAQSAADLQNISKDLKQRMATDNADPKKEKNWFNKLFGNKNEKETPKREKKKGEIAIPAMGPKAQSQPTTASEMARPASSSTPGKLSQTSSNPGGSFQSGRLSLGNTSDLFQSTHSSSALIKFTTKSL